MTPATGLPEGIPCWADVMLSDLAAGKRFYGELFGWAFAPPAFPGASSCTEARLRGRRAAALAQKEDGRMPTAWTLHFATQDTVVATDAVRAARLIDNQGPIFAVVDPTTTA